MSYALAAALQEAVYGRLSNDAALGALVGSAIFDALPAGPLPDTYVTLGPEDVRARNDVTGAGAWHRFTVSVVTAEAGFHQAKQVAGAIHAALTLGEITLDQGHLTGLHFLRARARREDGGALHRVDLIFQARVDETV